MRMTFTGSLSATLSPMITAGMVSCRGRVEDDRIELLDLFRPERDRGFESLSLHRRVVWLQCWESTGGLSERTAAPRDAVKSRQCGCSPGTSGRAADPGCPELPTR